MEFCSLSSGSSGNCIYIGSDKTKLIVDAGISKKSVDNSLKLIKVNTDQLDGILITHEHLDHYKSCGSLSRSYNIPLYMKEKTYEVLKSRLGNIFKINIIDRDEFLIGDLEIKIFSTPHDAVDPIGYTISNDKKRISIATDMGYFSNNVFENLKDSNIVLIESNYNKDLVLTGPYPYTLKQRILSDLGHLSNEDCGVAILKLLKNFPKTIILGHLSETNNFPELAYRTVEKIVTDNNLEIGKDLELTLAHRNLPSNYIRI